MVNIQSGNVNNQNIQFLINLAVTIAKMEAICLSHILTFMSAIIDIVT